MKKKRPTPVLRRLLWVGVLLLCAGGMFYAHTSSPRPAQAQEATAPPAKVAAPVAIRHVTAETFAAEVLSSPVPVIVQFDADWCPYCRKIQPMLSQLAADRAGRLVIYRVNIDRDRGLAQLFDIKSLPTLVMMNKGMEQRRLEGVPNKIRLYAWAGMGT